MSRFPEFMKHPANRIAASVQSTAGVEGSRMAFWTCSETACSAPHVHDFDEYMVVVEGCYTLIMEEERIPLQRGDEIFIAGGVPHSGEVVAGTRTIHAFGGRRAERA